MILKDDPKAYAIMGCAMRVHKELGFGFLESAYDDALEIEFAKAKIPYRREDEVRIFYDGKPLKTAYRADFTCFDREYIVELKAIKTLSKIEWAQVIHYMRATRTRYALLINFGREQLQYDTFDLDKLPTASVLDTTPHAPKSQPKTSLSQSVESECMMRSVNNSAERDSRAQRDSRRPREPHGSELTSRTASKRNLRPDPDVREQWSDVAGKLIKRTRIEGNPISPTQTIVKECCAMGKV